MDKNSAPNRTNFNSTPTWVLIRNTVTYLFLIIGVIIAVFPFFWMISTSLMSLGEAQGTRMFPSAVHPENYINAWKEAKFFRLSKTVVLC